MKIRVGYELIYEFPQPTPMIMVLGTHFTRASDIVLPDYLTTSPSVPIFPYRDVFGNWCSRIVAPAGGMRLSADCVVCDTGLPDEVCPFGPPTRGGGFAGRDADLSPRQSLLRDRPPDGGGLDALWQVAIGMGAGPDDLRLRPSPYRLRLRACSADDDRLGGFQRRQGG